MYYLLTESFKEQHTELVKIILDAVAADKIYFLGSTLMNRRTESIFMTDAPSCKYVGHYYVLVLIGNGQGLNVIQDKIENNCQHFIPVTAIVLHTDQFNQWVRVKGINLPKRFAGWQYYFMVKRNSHRNQLMRKIKKTKVQY